jgi:membrane-associated phospholipid phosphatase|tara:strand:+ start:115 stop:621 length:507 start_codon:yes stop_codon:yes gene_type:complete
MNDSANGNKIIRLMDTVGFLGPFILLGIGIWQLWGNSGFWCAYLVVFSMNSFINKIAKAIVKQPRPPAGESIMNENYAGTEMYGMPSGHAQSVFSSLTFLYLVKESPAWLFGELFIAGLTVYQRWKYRRHTVEQLGVGSVLGVVVAYAGYYITKRYLQENTLVENEEL